MVFLVMSIRSSEATAPYSSSFEYQAVSDSSEFSRFSSAFLLFCLFLFGFLCTQPAKSAAPPPLVVKTSKTGANPVSQEANSLAILPSDVSEVSNEIFSYLDARSLAACASVCSTWNDLTGDANAELWKAIFVRDMHEDGSRFKAPCGLGWRMYYYTHRVTRPVERMQLLAREGRPNCLVVNSVIYDMGSFIYQHPGGHRVIVDVLGTDATETWLQFEHSDNAQTYMIDLEVPDTIPPFHGSIASVVTTQQSSWKRMTEHMVDNAAAVADMFARFQRRVLSVGRDLA
ncbi:hypothetical protein AeMF1_000843 [Aphanomyces euteiches]|nr:hypothetical protein AeMF1_000843 [Aphanomyces euteiches]